MTSNTIYFSRNAFVIANQTRSHIAFNNRTENVTENATKSQTKCTLFWNSKYFQYYLEIEKIVSEVS